MIEKVNVIESKCNLKLSQLYLNSELLPVCQGYLVLSSLSISRSTD